MHNSYSKLTLRQLHAELTREHELFLKSLIEHKPKEFIGQVNEKINNLLMAIDARLKTFSKLRINRSDLQSKEAFLKVLV